MNLNILIPAFVVVAIASCTKQRNPPVAPVISDLSLSTLIVNSGSPLDTVFMTFKIADINGDIGIQDPNMQDIYLKSNWDPTAKPHVFQFPNIPTEVVDPAEALKPPAC